VLARRIALQRRGLLPGLPVPGFGSATGVIEQGLGLSGFGRSHLAVPDLRRCGPGHLGVDQSAADGWQARHLEKSRVTVGKDEQRWEMTGAHRLEDPARVCCIGGGQDPGRL
jgi:hypothetical protein